MASRGQKWYESGRRSTVRLRVTRLVGTAAASILLASAPVARAQQTPQPQQRAPRGQLVNIVGRVVLAVGMKEVYGVEVQLLQGLGMPMQRTYTDTNGVFEFRSLRKGMYIVEARLDRHEVARQSVDLSQMWGAEVRVRFTLTPLESGKAAAPRPEEATASVRELKIPAKAREAFAKGFRELNEKNRPERSVVHFLNAIELYPDYDEAYVQLSLAYLDKGNLPAAQKTLEDALAANGDKPRALVFLGVVYRRQEQPEKAEQALQKAVRFSAGDWFVHTELGQCLLGLGKIEAAWEHAERAHQLNGDALSVHLLLSGIAIRRHDFPGAIAHLDEYLQHPSAKSSAGHVRQQKETLAPLAKAAPDSPDLWQKSMDAARRAYDNRDYEQAENLLGVAADLMRAFDANDPRRVATQGMFGSVYLAQKRYLLAEESYKKSLAILQKTVEPDHPFVAVTLNNLAESYYLQGRYDQAEPLYQRSLEMLEKTLGSDHPHLATGLENYSALLRVTSRASEAKKMEALAKAIRAKQARLENPQ